MWKFLAGPLLLGALYLIGGIYGSKAEQVVRKPPGVVRAAVSNAVANLREGSMALGGGKSLNFELKLDRISDEQMIVKMAMNDKPSVETQLDFVSQNGGQDTLVTARVKTDGAAMREALAGTSQQRLSYAPDWLFNLAIRPVLRNFAMQIERGETIRDPSQRFQSRADWEAQLPREKQRQLQEWRQYDAVRPSIDPNKAAQNYMKGGGGP